MKGFIYVIANKDFSIVYVGSTIKKLSQRFTLHRNQYRKWLLDETKNCCSIYKYFKQYGMENFDFSLRKTVYFNEIEELLDVEQYYIDKYREKGICVNIANTHRNLCLYEHLKKKM